MYSHIIHFIHIILLVSIRLTTAAQIISSQPKSRDCRVLTESYLAQIWARSQMLRATSGSGQSQAQGRDCLILPK